MQNDQRLILYPRSYNRRGAEHLHSVKGVTRDGASVNIKLRDVAPGTPTVNELARTDRAATCACTAHPENGPSNRHGMLLFSRIEQEEVEPDGTITYKASAVEVLAEDARSAEPLIGLGRFEIKEGGPGKRTAFHAIHYQREGLAIFEVANRETVIASLADILEANTRHGMVGGLLVRPLDKEGYPLHYAQPEHFRRYIPSQQVYQPGADVAARLLERLPAGTHRLQVMPAIKVHSAKVAETHYSAPDQLDAMRRLFEPGNGNQPICNVAIRISFFQDSDMTLLYRLYPLSVAVGIATDDVIWSGSKSAGIIEVQDVLLHSDPLLRTSWSAALKTVCIDAEPVFNRRNLTPAPIQTNAPTLVADPAPTPTVSATAPAEASRPVEIPPANEQAVIDESTPAAAPHSQPPSAPRSAEALNPQVDVARAASPTIPKPARGLSAFLSRRDREEAQRA